MCTILVNPWTVFRTIPDLIEAHFSRFHTKPLADCPYKAGKTKNENIFTLILQRVFFLIVFDGFTDYLCYI